jgi:hypothetical protein
VIVTVPIVAAEEFFTVRTTSAPVIAPAITEETLLTVPPKGIGTYMLETAEMS